MDFNLVLPYNIDAFIWCEKIITLKYVYLLQLFINIVNSFIHNISINTDIDCLYDDLIQELIDNVIVLNSPNPSKNNIFNKSVSISLLNNLLDIDGKCISNSNSDSDFEFDEHPLINKKINEYKIIHFLGKGSSGTVYIGLNEQSGKVYAIKMIENVIKNNFKRKNSTNIHKEIYIMKHLNHRNIVKFYDAIYDFNNNIIYLVMQYLPHGNLINIKNNSCEIYTKDKICNYIIDIIKGLMYLHKHQIIHRDLKPENILLDEYDKPILVDFGVSLVLSHDNSIQKMKGTPYFMAPELLDNLHYPASFASDIWSLGVIIYIMMFGKYPFTGNTFFEISNNIIHKDLEIPDCSPEEKEVIIFVLEKNPDKRINLQDIMKLPYFAHYLEHRKSSTSDISSIDSSLISNKSFIDKLLIVNEQNVNNNIINEWDDIDEDDEKINNKIENKLENDDSEVVIKIGEDDDKLNNTNKYEEIENDIDVENKYRKYKLNSKSWSMCETESSSLVNKFIKIKKMRK